MQRQIHRYLSYYPQEQVRLKPLLAQLEMAMDVTNRKSLPGHITASGLVLHAAKMLLVRHPFLKKWLQPGGHIEAGEIALEAAKREVLEETGFATQVHEWHKRHSAPFDIDIHRIPANKQKQEAEHLHYDFRYLLCLDETRTPKAAASHPTHWADLKDIDEPNLKELLAKLTSRGLWLAKA